MNSLQTLYLHQIIQSKIESMQQSKTLFQSKRRQQMRQYLDNKKREDRRIKIIYFFPVEAQYLARSL